jgi:hypothetical protein
MVENEDVAVAVGVVVVVVAFVVVCCDEGDGSGLGFAVDEVDVIFVIRVISSVTRGFTALLS